MRVTLHRQFYVNGVVSTDSGEPVPDGSTLRAYVVARTTPEDFSPERLLQSRRESSRGARRVGDTIWIQWSRRERLGPDGAFRVPVARGGSVRLVAHVPGHAPARVDLQGVASDVEGATVRVSRATSAHARLLSNGHALEHWRVVLTDVTDRSVQTSTEFETSSEGECDSAWFEIGRSYWIVASRPPTVPRGSMSASSVQGFLVWSKSSAEIRFEDLATRIEDVPTR
jgi:hypothetical protein